MMTVYDEYLHENYLSFGCKIRSHSVILGYKSQPVYF